MARLKERKYGVDLVSGMAGLGEYAREAVAGGKSATELLEALQLVMKHKVEEPNYRLWPRLETYPLVAKAFWA